MVEECYKCRDTFTCKQGLWRHLRVKHGPPKFLHCKRCSFKEKRRDNFGRHYRICHPDHRAEGALIQAKLEKEPRRGSPVLLNGGITLPVSVDRSVLVGRLARDNPTKRSSAPATVSKPPPSPKAPAEETQPPLSPTVISLSPTPISPLQAPPRSPSIRLGGKPRTMLAIMRGEPANTDGSPPGTVSESSSKSAAPEPGQDIGEDSVDPPEVPARRTRFARVEETLCRKTYLGDTLVDVENITRVFLKPVDPSRYTLDP